jgi:hypothetical protein
MSHQLSSGTRAALPEKLARQIQSQMTRYAHTDLKGYTLERQKSDFHGAKADLTVYNAEGERVVSGRDFGDRIFFWQL